MVNPSQPSQHAPCLEDRYTAVLAKRPLGGLDRSPSSNSSLSTLFCWHQSLYCALREWASKYRAANYTPCRKPKPFPLLEHGAEVAGARGLSAQAQHESQARADDMGQAVSTALAFPFEPLPFECRTVVLIPC